jgi:V/A-type H+-transporting ATPase subunit D
VDVQHEGVVRERGERALGQFDLSAHTTEAIGSSEQMLEQLIECAPAEANLRILGEEIKKVSRRINALEEQLLPRLRSDVSRIQAVLEERQREDVFRMKRYKKRKEALAKAKAQAGGED